MMRFIWMAALLALGSSAGAREKMADPALDKLATLSGGRWVHEGKGFTVEFTYELAQGGKAVRGNGIVNKGKPTEMHITAMYGFDPKAKKAYYIDFHDHETVYKGTVTARGSSLDLEFAGLIGDSGTYRARIDLLDADHFKSVILVQKDGAWTSLEGMEFTRHR